MAHVQVVPVAKQAIVRDLHLTGTVAYNAFKTTPVFSAVGGPVHEILVAPGENVKAGQTLLTVNSPDYSLDRSTYLKARDAFQLADKQYQRAKDLYDHKAIAEADLQQAESARAQAQADVESSADALRVLGISDPESLAEESAFGASAAARAGLRRNHRPPRGPGPIVAGRRHAMLHDFRHEHRVGSRECLSKRSRGHSPGRPGGHHHRRLSRYVSRQDFLRRRHARPEHAHICKRASLPTIPARN